MDAVPMIAQCMRHQQTWGAVERERLLREAGCVAHTDFENGGVRSGQSLPLNQADQPPVGSFDTSW